MASICLSAPTTTIDALLKPIPSNPKQISFRNSVSFSLPLAFHPLRCSSIYNKHRFSSIVSMAASSSDRTNDPVWKSLEKSIEIGKKQSVEDLLRQQIEKREYYNEGGGGGNPPRGRRGGGGGGGDGFGESEDKGFAGASDETIQVILATIGFIFMYLYITNGVEMTKLAKDYLSFLFGGRKSIRLTRAMSQWDRFWKNLTPKKEVDRFGSEKAIINTPTWWGSPEKYMRLLKALLPGHRSDADEDTRDGYEDTGEGYNYQGS